MSDLIDIKTDQCELSGMSISMLKMAECIVIGNGKYVIRDSSIVFIGYSAKPAKGFSLFSFKDGGSSTTIPCKDIKSVMINGKYPTIITDPKGDYLQFDLSK